METDKAGRPNTTLLFLSEETVIGPPGSGDDGGDHRRCPAPGEDLQGHHQNRQLGFMELRAG
jgi:hypothetical protein